MVARSSSSLRRYNAYLIVIIRNATRMYGAILKGPGLNINTSMSHVKMNRRRTWNKKQNHGRIMMTGTAKMHTQTHHSKFGKTRKEHLLLEHRRYLECKPQKNLDLCKATVVLLNEFM